MRLKVTFRNLFISQIIILLFLSFAYIIWFPHDFAKLGGFYKTAYILVFADLILGPLLVFIIFKEGKKYLKFDINILLGIQILAFLYGAYALYLKHPAYAVFKHDRFILTNVSQLYPKKSWYYQLKESFFTSPRLVIANFPSEPSKQFNLALDIDIKGQPDIEKRPELFKAFKDSINIVFSKSMPVDYLPLNNKTKKKLSQFYKQYGGKVSDYAYFPLSGNNKKNVIWVFDRHTFNPVGIIDTDPFLLAKK